MTLRSKIILMTAVLAFAWSAMSAAAAPTLLFQNYSSAEGLPNRGVCTFTQDRFGSIWVGTEEGICMFDGSSFITPTFLLQEPFRSASGRVICIDSMNVLWLGSREGVMSYSLNTGESQMFKEYRPSQIICDREGTVWMNCQTGLVSFSPDKGEWDSSLSDVFKPVNICINSTGELCATATDGCIYIKKKDQSGFSRTRILHPGSSSHDLTLVNIAPCDEDRLLYSTSDNSSFCLDLRSGQSRKFFDGHLDGHDAILTGIIARSPQEFWATTDNGLYVYNDEDKTCSKYLNYSGDPYSLASSKIRCLFIDEQRRIWIGTFYDGISRLMNSGPNIQFLRRRPEDPEYSMNGRTVRSICAGDGGMIWAATEDGFLEKIYPDGRITSFGYDKTGMSRNNTYQSIAYDSGKVYAADLGDGITVYDSESLKLLKKYNVSTNYCGSILFTSSGEMLVGTSTGLYRLERGTDSFVRIESVPDGFVTTICEDRRGNIWAGVSRQGIYVLPPSSYDANLLEIQGNAYINRLNISDLYEDRDGRIWAATSGSGVAIIKPGEDIPWKAQCTTMTKNEGLPSNMSCAITQDDTGRIWLSTMNGIVSIESDTVTDVTEYTTIGNCFCQGSVLKAPDGMIYMGSSDGMVAFNPYDLPQRKHTLFLADIIKSKDNTSISVSEDGCSPFTSKSIRIKSYETTSLTIRLMCLKTDVNEVVKYRYSLTGKGREIINTSNEQQITYANLTPGRYSFTAKVSRDDSPEACVSLLVQVVPPFYSSLAAKVFYALLLLGCIFVLFYFRLTLMRKEKENAIERLEANRQKEVYESKINFFTNISHEIRTPLTLIKVPLDKIMSSKSYLPESEYDMKCIQNSTDRLLDITDQILDFRKMENGTANLTFSLADLTKLVGDVCTRMEGLAKESSVSFSYDIPDAPISVMCAPGSIDKIVSNLLMNGIKYCSSRVELVMKEIGGENVRISVMSDGAPIEAEEREKIFKPFYQSSKNHSRLSMNEGTGLGLSLARSLANLHEGTLMLDPAYKDGNSFVLEIPMGQNSEKSEMEEDRDPQIDEHETSKYSVLIVEDDQTLNNYIKTELSSEYTVYQANNGKQALALLNEKSVSLIVSDIMMPEMDGCELVDVVKNTMAFSHIPIILLTAVTDYDTQLNSLHSGADGYITKPFSMQILRATIFNILKNREIIYDRFSSMPYTRPENTTSSRDDEFMKHLYEYVLENISNQDLSVLDLAEKMNASRSTVFRKIRANTGMNINEYIRVCRLKKAAELLSTQKYQIKEVAYMVGFTSVSYFTKSFQKQFNISPSSLLKKN